MYVFYKLNPRKLERYLPYLQEAEVQHNNEDTTGAWLYGMYNARAIGACFSKGSRYPDKPEGLIERHTSDEPAYEFTDADRFACFASAYNRSHHLEETASGEGDNPSS